MAFVMPDTLTLNTAGTVSVDVVRWWLKPDNTRLEFDIVLSCGSPWHEFTEGLDGVDKQSVRDQLGLGGVPMRAEFHVTGPITGRVILQRV